MLKEMKRKISKLYMKKQLSNERTYQSEECSLSYLFSEHSNSNKLLVIFSGFPAQNQQAVYNYVLKFKKIKCNKLFILDSFGFDKRGAYYLGKNGDFFIARAVTELIEKVREDHSITKANIITSGSSKGGFAALYFALNNGYGTAIAGEPQILLGDYLSIPAHKKIYKYIIGKQNEENTNKMNRLILDTIEEVECFPEIHLLCGENGIHHLKHINPLLKKLDVLNLPYNIKLENFENHGNVGKYFPAFAISVINSRL